MKILKLLLQFIPIVLLVFEPVAVKSQQPYQSSISLQYGFLNYNSYQHDIFNFDSKFRSGGITYRQQLGRLSGINFSGKYYKWSLDNSSDLETYALQSMVVFHAGKISSSWRINRLTPYLGAGIGYQQHTLMQEGAESEFRNLYVPLEAGLMFNISSRWSIGAFAEYKIAFGSDIKKQLGVDEKNPDIVNSAGIKLSYSFGSRKTDYSFPRVHTIPPSHSTEEDQIIRDGVKVTEKLEKKTISVIPKIDTTAEVTIKPAEPQKIKGPAVTFKVVDKTLFPVTGASITFDSISGVTDKKGEYSFIYTVRDTYAYTVSATAFLPVRGTIKLDGNDARLTIPLSLASQTEGIEVSPLLFEPVADSMLVEVIEEKIDFEKDKPAITEMEESAIDYLAQQSHDEKERKILLDTLAREVVLAPKPKAAVADTMRIPVVLDIIVNRQIAGPASFHPENYQPHLTDASNVFYTSRMDSLLLLTNRLQSRITSLENTTTSLMAQRYASLVHPAQDYQPQHVQPQMPRKADIDMAMIQAQASHELEFEKLTKNIEVLSMQVQQLSLGNQKALDDLNKQLFQLKASKVAALPVAEPSDHEQPEPVKIIVAEKTAKENSDLPQSSIKTEEDDNTIELLKMETEQLSINQKELIQQLEDLQNLNQRLLQEIAELSKQPETKVKDVTPEIFEYTINFAINSAIVDDMHIPRLAEFVSQLRSNPEKKVVLSGFADAIGDPLYNMLLSQRRVQSVKSALLKMGVKNRQVVEQFFGSEKASGGIDPSERKVEVRIFQ